MGNRDCLEDMCPYCMQDIASYLWENYTCCDPVEYDEKCPYCGNDIHVCDVSWNATFYVAKSDDKDQRWLDLRRKTG